MEDDAAFARALGARGADVILAQRLRHRGAHEPGIGADTRQGQRRHRQSEMAREIERPAAADGGNPARRQPAKGDGEDEYEDQREPERRYRDAGKAGEVDRMIERRMRPPCRRDPAGDCKGQREQEAQPHDERAIAEPRQQHRDGGLAEEPRIAEIALQRRRCPGEIAVEQRAVDAVNDLQPGDVGGCQLWIGGDHQVDRIAGHQADQPIDHERHECEDDEKLGQAPGEETRHRRRAPFTAPANPRPTASSGIDGRSARR